MQHYKRIESINFSSKSYLFLNRKFNKYNLLLSKVNAVIGTLNKEKLSIQNNNKVQPDIILVLIYPGYKELIDDLDKNRKLKTKIENRINKLKSRLADQFIINCQTDYTLNSLPKELQDFLKGNK